MGNPPPILEYATPPLPPPPPDDQKSWRLAVLLWTIGFGAFLFIPMVTGFFVIARFKSMPERWIPLGVAALIIPAMIASVIAKPLLRKMTVLQLITIGAAVFLGTTFYTGPIALVFNDALVEALVMLISLVLPVLGTACGCIAVALRRRAERR